MGTETKRAFLTAMEKLHGPRLRRFLSRCLRLRSDAPDLAQEVFLRLLRVEDHEAIRNPQAYLFTIANHVLHQHALRQSATDVTQLAEVITELNAVEELPDPLTELETEQRFAALARALEDYSPRAYATFILHRCDGIPLKEIATRFGVSYTMVKRYLAHAVAFCQQKLQEIE